SGIDSLWRKLECRNEPPKEEARRLRRKVSAEARIYDPCDSIIRHIETVAKSTGEVYGDKHRKRAAMAERIGLQLRWLVDAEREREPEHPKARNAESGENGVTPLNETPDTETLDDVKTELMNLIGLEAVKNDFLSISNLLRNSTAQETARAEY